MNKYLPLELVNKIFIIRPTHRIVNILRNNVNEQLDNYGTGNIIYCYDKIFCLQTATCCIV